MAAITLVRSTGYVVIELKTGKFQPEYAGKLSFYVALVVDVLRRDHRSGGSTPKRSAASKRCGVPGSSCAWTTPRG